MKESQAAGPKTELVGVSQGMQQSIEEMIASVSRGIGDCMENARNAEPRSLADDTRSSERRDAVQMISSTAELLSSIAKLKGEFSHNYHIVRDASAEERTLRAEKKHEVSLMRSQSEVEDMSDEEYVDYHRAMKGLPPKYKKTWYTTDRDPNALDDTALAALEAEVARAERAATTPSRKTPVRMTMPRNPRESAAEPAQAEAPVRRKRGGSAWQSQPADAWPLQPETYAAPRGNARAHPRDAQSHDPDRDDGEHAEGAAEQAAVLARR